MNWETLCKDFIRGTIHKDGLCVFLERYYKIDNAQHCSRKFFNEVIKSVFNECLITKIQLEILHYKLFNKHMKPIILSNLKYERAEHCYIHYINYNIAHLLDVYKDVYKEPMPLDYFDDVQYSKAMYIDVFGHAKLSTQQLCTLLSDS